jgi:hypothetical protein
MKRTIGVLLLFILIGNGNLNAQLDEGEYLNSIGDIAYNRTLDDSIFHRCHAETQTAQYFNFYNGFRFKGEKDSLIDIFANQYKPINKEGQNGYVRIRFVVNCNGESGLFRVLESDENFNPYNFDYEIIRQLLAITKSLNGWYVVSDDSNSPIDYYQYLIFKIEHGTIKELMP